MARTNTVVPIRVDDEMGRAAGETVITLGEVTKVFDSRHGQVHALDGINLSVRNKEFVCLLGPSGCGKSTILGLIAGLTRPSSGSVTINDQSIDAARQAHRI